MSIFDKIGSILNPVKDIIDDLTLSKEEKAQFQATFTNVMNGVYTLIMGYESQLLESKTSIITAEVQSQSWITRNWRPLMMLWFAGLVGAHWFGYTPPNLPEEQVMALLEIVKYGISGYVIGRSGEKIAPKIVEALTANKHQ